jgi:hypothetical protein
VALSELSRTMACRLIPSAGPGLLIPDELPRTFFHHMVEKAFDGSFVPINGAVRVLFPPPA